MDSRIPVSGAIITLSHDTDTAVVHRTWTDTSGVFRFAEIDPGTYLLQVNHLAYHHARRTITITASSGQIEDVLLRPRTIPIGEVLVHATPPAVQKADTTEYVADAFKLHRDAQAEDLLMKLPGVSVTEGIVRAGGEEVKQVLVDGRPFFGTDPLIALRNIPADAIEKVQVFEKMSEQSEFTGFDDGQSMRTINIITRESRRRSQFGRASAGYGESGRYVATGSGNIFNGTQRISLLGQSNNANQQNFSAQDILGSLGGPPGGGGPRGGFGEGRPRGGPGGGPGGGAGGAPPQGGMGRPGGTVELANSMIGIQSGISTVHSIGTNYTDMWQSGVNITGSYFFNRSDNENDRSTHRDYTIAGDTRTAYEERSTGSTGNGNHRFSMRLDVPIDSMNSLLFVPNVSYQSTDGISVMDGASLFAGGSSSVASTDSWSSSTGYTLSQNVLYRHKFDLPGRTISVDATLSGNARDRDATLGSSVSTDGNLADLTRQQRSTEISGLGYSARVAYTEPMTVNSQAQVEVQSSLTRSASDTRTYNEDSIGVRTLDQALSNSYDNLYWSQRGGVSYQIRTTSTRFTVGAALERATLEGERRYPSDAESRYTFWSVLPSVTLDHSPALGHHFRVNYRGSTQAPSITQLQDVVDNSNPLFLSGGNPSLRQTYTHSLTARLLETEADRATSRMFMVMVSAANDYVANHIRTLHARHDPCRWCWSDRRESDHDTGEHVGLLERSRECGLRIPSRRHLQQPQFEHQCLREPFPRHVE
ncbi:MAG: TonB-dependent receptor [Ignavibacteriae bacterium]|nr:TonB-dependent receptor [Ignavibacteriota bacterium]